MHHVSVASFVRRLRSLWLPWLLLVSSLTCVERVTWPFPDDALPITPPVQYRRWWAMTEACSGRTGDFDAVRWFTVPTGTLKVEGHEYDGIWYHTGNRIVLTAWSLTDGQTARHEMLHAILQDGSHPPAAFVDHCGGIVVIDTALHIAPASLSPGPTAGSPLLEARALLTSVDVSASTVSVGLPDSGWVSFTVTVTNPLDVPVWVRVLPRHENQYAAATFGMQPLLVGSGDGYAATDYSIDFLVPFAARESKRRVFDERLSGLQNFLTWRFTGLFNEDTVGTRTVTLVR